MAQDYSEWLTPDRLDKIEHEWSQMDRSELCAKIMEHKPESIIEYCCGTGWIPLGLPLDVYYLGIDANQGCIGYAMKKNPTRNFGVEDVRDHPDPRDPFDMALAFSCLKHFELAEWETIYSKILRAGKKTLTSIYMGKHACDEPGYGFPHTMVTLQMVERIVRENGHRIVQIFTLPPLNKEPEPLVLTEAVDERIDLVSPEGSGTDEGDVRVRPEVLGGVQSEGQDSGGEGPDDAAPGVRSEEPQGPSETSDR